MLTHDPAGAADTEDRERAQKVPLQPTNATQANETAVNAAPLLSQWRACDKTMPIQTRHCLRVVSPPAPQKGKWDQLLSHEGSEVTVEVPGKGTQVGCSSRESPDASKHGTA